MVFVITSYRNNKKDRDEYLWNSYTRKEEQLKTYLSHIDYTAYTIIFSNWVQRLMYIDQVSSKAEFQEYQRNVTHFLGSLASVNDDISFVVISGSGMVWSNNTLHYDLKYDIKKQPWFNELTEKQKYIEYGKSELFAGAGNVWSMTLYYPVISYFNFSLLGYLAVNVTSEKLNFLAAGANEIRGETVSIYDRQGNLIVSNNQAAGDRGAFFTGKLLDGEWTAEIGVRHFSNPFSGLGSLNLIFLLLIPIIILFVMIIAAFSRYLTVPIIKCKNAMLEIRKKHFGLRLENHYSDEIGELISGFNDMSGDLALLIRQNAEVNARRREAEINMLQQKVNPHFLYNTLEIVNALIISGRNKSAMQVCEILGSIYHYNLMNRKWVSLREECDYIKRYLLIIHHKMSGLSVCWETDETALNTEILKLTLQPLVENAVLHGLGPDRSQTEDACLTITIRGLEHKTEIIVMDNGSGIESGDLADIEKNLEYVRLGIPFDNPHMGMPNVYQRLYLEYGEAMNFAIESRPGYGTKIIITLPAAMP